MDTLYKPFRDYMLVTRSVNNLTQEQMASFLQISVRSYSDIERGVCNPSTSTLINFLVLLPDHEIIHLFNQVKQYKQENGNNYAQF